MPNAEPVSPALDRTFRISVTLKGIDGAFEAVGGAALLFVRPAAISHLLRSVTQHELSQDPHDFVAGHIFHYATHLAHGSTIFAAVYLLSHGLAKLVLVVALPVVGQLCGCLDHDRHRPQNPVCHHCRVLLVHPRNPPYPSPQW